jgi:hypothetical protein
MPRISFLLALLTLTSSSFAQVTVQSNGIATAAGPGIQGAPASPPTLYAPIVRLGQGQTQPIDSNALNPQVLSIDSLQPQTRQQGDTAAPATNNASTQAFNFGVARFDLNPFQSSGMNSGESLGEIARELRQHEKNLNAKSFTNADIQRLDQQTSGGIAGATAANNNWPANNGVITPQSNTGQGAVAAPAQGQPAPVPNGPFGPRPENSNPDSAQPSPADPPQAEAKPSAEHPYEMAQNNPANAGLPAQDQGNSSDSSQPQSSSNNANTSGALPKTASKLPLFGVLGLFSVSMGLFVRYQRAKAR